MEGETPDFQQVFLQHSGGLYYINWTNLEKVLRDMEIPPSKIPKEKLFVGVLSSFEDVAHCLNIDYSCTRLVEEDNSSEFVQNYQKEQAKGNYDAALKHLVEGSEAGIARAQALLGLCYKHGVLKLESNR